MNDKSDQSALSPKTAREQRLQPETPIDVAGQLANRIAGQHIFQRYMSQKAANTIRRQARDLELFAEYLLDVAISPDYGADFQTNPQAWQGITWGIVEGFAQWLLHEGYAINSVNARLSTVRTYAGLAVKADAVDREEGLLIQSVSGFSRQEGLNVDQQRDQTRIDEITYAYRPPQKRRSVVVTRRSTKKSRPSVLDDHSAALLKTPRSQSPQGWRDALLMCLLLDHGLRASEAALLTVDQIDPQAARLRFFRPKIKGTKHEWTTHSLTVDTRRTAAAYLAHYPPTLLPHGPLILATTRLLKDGSGGQLKQKGLNRVRISERVAWLAKDLGLPKLSAHDCRHYCATQMARLDYGVDELMAWFGWTSAQTAMRYVSSTEIQERHRG